MKHFLRKVSIMLLFLMPLLASCSSLPVTINDYVLEEDNKLTVYTSHKEEVYSPIIKEFEERTGIWVQVTCGGTSEILEQIASESKNPICDVMFGGGVESLEAYSNYFVPYKYSEEEILDRTYKSDSCKWIVFSKLPIVFVYNNKLVYETAAPKGWEDLLQDRWKGKVAYADPHKSGSGYTILMTLMQVMGKDNWNAMVRFSDVLDGKILDDSSEVINEVASGTKLVGITLEESALKKIAAGIDITMVYPIEGTSEVPDGSALILNGPHENNAKLFLDFVVSKDVQRMIADYCYRRPVRKDISDLGVRSEEAKFIDYDINWASDNRSKILKKWDMLNQ
ncbi:MAG: ABC transporter substrate-binding protein [Clostridiaceae bacterium]|nr:ABC transporter substrate-binding protein [Clostridiaceae bacterium]